MMNIHEILLDIHALEEELLGFERKYGVRSEIFSQPIPPAKNRRTINGCSILANGRPFIVPGS